ncbi:hypothetical protein HHK36_010637 [Tetracentron sinense]|uniref:DCD domain-containing protein n=1 Tax=Tetracentron sinense TaxID=13715 RepID=A0A834ZAS7_TETSI|nr:hypothetical protein HHK36_010637 [Tetracentron sinense]
MGAGRKTQTFTLHERTPYSSPTGNSSVTSRNLRKVDLGGVIFGCKHSTMRECLFKQLFGLPTQHYSYVRNILPGLPLFLFNYSDRKLHGIFEAASPGQMNINPYGWTTDGSERTFYPAQVRIHIRMQCEALLEDQFRPIISDNYYTQSHFWFELDHAQTSRLISLFSSSAVPPSTSAQQNTAKWRSMFKPVPTLETRQEGEVLKAPPSDVGFTNSYETNAEWGSSCVPPSLDEETQPLEAHIEVEAEAEEKNEEELVYLKLQQLSLNRGCSNSATVDDGEDNVPFVTSDGHLEDGCSLGQMVFEENEDISISPSDVPSIVAQLMQGMKDLKASHLEQVQKISFLELKLAESEIEIHQLNDRCKMLESTSNHSMEPVDEPTMESNLPLDSSLDDLIYLAGGFDGVSWLSALDSYSPSLDVMKPLRPMSSIRSYASVAKLNGELYIFGGGNGIEWYNTVESYNPLSNQWTVHPSLRAGKGSLAGATINDKIFAIGGGNGVECFSEVELFDAEIGRWISTQSMLHKRFAPAAAELNGVLYVVGGYDGKDYLKSAERFDPREYSWTRLESMNTRRGCHSLAVMNGNLYASGGYDGTKMVSSVEIFDPRIGSWRMGDPMNHSRGYSAPAVIGESIYVIGGVKDDKGIVDTVECYKEGHGWQITNLKAVGKRCFFSAIVL